MASSLRNRAFACVLVNLCVALTIDASPSTASAQTHAQAAAVQMWAEVQRAPAQITVRWVAFAPATGYTLYRRVKGVTSWGTAIATLGASATQYVDTSVALGTYYEYRIVRPASLGAAYAGDLPGTGYIASGIEVSLEEYRGKMILLVDNTVAASLTAELQTLADDLVADGWTVIRHDVSRTATVTSIRTMLQTDYNADPSVVHGLYMVGHIPVPYAGSISPAGHFPDHYGAWSADTYYCDLNGTWTDSSVNNSGASRAETINVPGDGKFDQSDVPTACELQVGRVDLSRMPAFASSEVELLRSYLNRAHGFKIASWQPMAQGLVSDNLDWAGAGLVASGLRSIGALVGPANVSTGGGAPYGSLIGTNSYLFAFAGAGGGYTAAAVSTDELAMSFENHAVFNMSLGSYFGDWDNENNLLRAYIGRGQALVSVWSGLPNWWFHHMGMGDTVGFSTQISESNTASQYSPVHNGWQSPDELGKVHLGLMGDPSLRLKMIAPPTNVTTSDAGGLVRFAWTASTSSPLGYHVYKIDPTSGVVTRLTTSVVASTSYTSTSEPYVNGRRYMVRAVKLETGATGSYFNLSLGGLVTNTGATSMTDAGVPTDMGTMVDSGTPVDDAGTAPMDAGSTVTDSGTPPNDAGSSVTDFGIPNTDASVPPDAATVADAGAPVVSGVALTSGCACSAANTAPQSSLAALAVMGIALAALRRSRRRRKV